jgi:hypothetical protein
MSAASKKEWLINEAATDIHRVAVVGQMQDSGWQFDINWTIARLKRLLAEVDKLQDVIITL